VRTCAGLPGVRLRDDGRDTRPQRAQNICVAGAIPAVYAGCPLECLSQIRSSLLTLAVTHTSARMSLEPRAPQISQHTRFRVAGGQGATADVPMMFGKLDCGPLSAQQTSSATLRLPVRRGVIRAHDVDFQEVSRSSAGITIFLEMELAP